MSAYPRNALLAFSGVFAALAVLVATGVFTGLDQWAVDHVMPGLAAGHQGPSLPEAAIPLWHASWDAGVDVAANIVTLPAQGLVSLLVLIALRNWGLLGACIVADGIEHLCKSVIVRPPLYDPVHNWHLVGFDSSFPSGHTVRSVLVALAVAAAWPRVRALAFAWAASSIVLLLLAGAHVPSDLFGGLALAAVVVSGLALLPRGRAARALRARGLRAPARGAR